MEKTIDFDVIGIAEAIKRNTLVVPPNQREYAWLADAQVKDLLQDISKAMRAKNQIYFLGTLVLTRGNKGVLEIADGQQRLATTTMILAAIRDWYSTISDTIMVQSIENEFLIKIDRNQREKISRLTLNLDDNEYFKNTIVLKKQERTQSKSTRRSHKLLQKAFEYIKSFFKNIETQYGLDGTKEHLNEWISFLEKHASIVQLVVDDPENAFIMFETLNDRGLKTSQADLVKNYLFGIADNRLSEAQKLWSSMKAAIETVSDDDEDITMDFLRASFCIISGATRDKDVMSRVKEKAQSKNECIAILTLFEEMSKDYAAILNPDHQKWNDYDVSVRKSIQTINLFGVTQIRPLMLAVTRFFNPQNTAIAFRKLVSWSVRFLVRGIRGGRLDEGYARLSFAIYNREIQKEDQLKKSADKFVVSDAEFGEAFANAKVGVTKLARYYLRSLETTARGEDNPEFVPNEGDAINLEHIMPQSLVNGWSHINPQDAESHFSRLGNMALLQAVKNSKIGDISFNEKKEVYRESSFLLTNQISEVEKWDAEAIDNRQNILAKFAIKTWSL